MSERRRASRVSGGAGDPGAARVASKKARWGARLSRRAWWIVLICAAVAALSALLATL